MFTGLVQAIAEVVSLEHNGENARLVILPPPQLHARVARGDSVAVNGLCLSAVDLAAGRIGFDVIPESLRRSNLGDLQAGDRVNVETALRAGDALDGHLMSGHIDCTGEVVTVNDSDGERRLAVQIDPSWMRFVFAKGSVALNGVSLTLASVQDDTFAICLIPLTLADTNLGQVRPGDRLNVEIDQTARYIVETAERLWRNQQKAS